MLDKTIQQALKPLMTRAARSLVRLGLRADTITLVGFATGMAAATAIALQHYLSGLALLLLSRLMDGLDGAVARATSPTDRGGFLDITLDFLFYAAIPLAFALADPPANALPAAVLLAAFIGTGSSFLAFAAVAEKRQLQSLAFPDKSFYFLGGLTEATETILAFTAMCLWPQWFAQIAYCFAVLCGITAVLRIGWGWQRFR
ncbi:MAG: CDP-alcohol phosphatidyltransferase family protein [Hydrogenophaga sp.]|nr:CDP-alcohol phosphatidyltransferase family protein [Hydrogenophaga sp.]MDP2092289.1 CDP-alcohol phosphatidyltransferase family protein [Hydrogenophaga sp.]